MSEVGGENEKRQKKDKDAHIAREMMASGGLTRQFGTQ